MIIVAWNLAHQTHERKIKKDFLASVESLKPDVLVLNEYVHGPSRTGLVTGLSELGLTSMIVSVRIRTHNQVLIASRYRLVEAELRGIPTENGAGESNFLHVVIKDFDLEVIGVRVPSYEGRARKDYWERFERLAHLMQDRRLVFVGDLNADPNKSKTVGDKTLARLRDSGWRLPDALGARSFKSGSRLDHALVSPSLPVPSAEYCMGRDGVVFCGQKKGAISDHAPIVVTINI